MKKLTFLIILAAMVMFCANQAFAVGNLIPSIKVGGGWVSVVSYVNTMPPAGAPARVFVHATYQVKNPDNFTNDCVHLDGLSETTENDLTTTVLDTTGGGVGTVYPVGDTTGSAIISPPTVNTTTEGFLVLENYDNAGALGADGTLTSEAIVFNLADGSLYSQRALPLTHNAINNVDINAPLCNICNFLAATPFSAGGATVFANTTAGTLTRFMFLPPADVQSGAYVIAANRPGTAEAADSGTTINLAAPNYDAEIRVEARRDAASGYALGIYDRLEQFRSLTERNEIVCLAELSPDDLTGSTVPSFIADGGWLNLSARCREMDPALQVCDGDAAGTELGDAGLFYKVEFAGAYGFAITPLNQQWYAK